MKIFSSWCEWDLTRRQNRLRMENWIVSRYKSLKRETSKEFLKPFELEGNLKLFSSFHPFSFTSQSHPLCILDLMFSQQRLRHSNNSSNLRENLLQEFAFTQTIMKIKKMLSLESLRSTLEGFPQQWRGKDVRNLLHDPSCYVLWSFVLPNLTWMLGLTDERKNAREWRQFTER